MKFGDKVRSARRKQGLTQRQLAEEVGVSLRTINGYENENRLPRSRELYEKLAGALCVTTNYLRTEDASYLFSRTESIRPESDTAKVWEVLQEIRRIFDDNMLPEEIKEELMHGISEAYWVSRKRG